MPGKNVIVTELGALEVLMRHGESALVCTPSGGTVTFRETQYTVNLDLELRDGVWVLEESRSLSPRVRYAAMSKYFKSVPPTFESKIVKVASEAFQTYLQRHPDAVAAAAVEYADKAVKDAQSNVDKLAAQLAEAQARLAQAQERAAAARLAAGC